MRVKSIGTYLIVAIFASAMLLYLFTLPAGAWTVNFTHYNPTVNSSPQYICAGPDGNVWFTEASADRIGRITPAGSIAEYPLASGSCPMGICAGPDGNLWYAASSTSKIGRITTAGAVNEYALAVGSIPTGICAGPDGNLWYTASGTDKIGKITTAGAVTEFALPNRNSNPWSICAGPDGALWFTENWGDRIGRIATDGQISEYDLDPLSGPVDIAPGPDGALWYTATGSSKIGRITTAGAITEYPTPTPSAGPNGICHGPGGVMWVAEYNIKSFARVRMDGTMTEALICGGAGDFPNYVCTGPDGSLWWTEYGLTSYIGKGVTDSPYILGITPETGQRGTVVSVTDLAGNNFGVGGAPAVKLTRQGQADITATNVTVVSGNKITCDFAIPAGAALGAWNVVAVNGDGQSDTLYGGFMVTAPAPDSTWYLAEGCTAGGFETWVLVQNPNAGAVTVDLTLMTEAGPQNPTDLQGVPIQGNSRKSFNIGAHVQTYDVSTRVDSYGGDVVCERAVYGGGRTWGTDSIGTKLMHNIWYLAEGCTQGDFETWVLVMNPNAVDTTVDLTFMTSGGPQPGPQDVNIPAYSRKSFNVAESVVDWNVSTMVLADDVVVCERAMYGGGRTWAHDSVGVTAPQSTWCMAEGSTAGGFETWVLVQNPNAGEVRVNLTLMTENGPQNPPDLQGVAIQGNSRKSFDLGQYVQTYDVSTQVDVVSGGPVICERAVYGAGRVWGTDSIGTDVIANTWLLPEGCTNGDFETWVLVMNPNTYEVEADLTFMTSSGIQPGPQNVKIPAFSRKSFNAGESVADWDVSIRVEATGPVACERAMYGGGRTWAHDSIGYIP